MRFCTIANAAYGAQACVAAEACRTAYPESSFTWVTIGSLPEWCHGVVPSSVTLVQAEDIIDDFDWRAFAYDVMELATSIKPECILHLLSASAEPLVFIDPDVWIRSRLSSVEKAFADADIILTPHMLHPTEDETLSFRETCRYGAYNLGFLGLRSTTKARDCMRWWAQRTHRACSPAVESGMYMDQRWADLVPSLFDSVSILRDPTVNVAWWNALTRDWARAALIHFSGFDPARPSTVTRYRPNFSVEHLTEAGAATFRAYYDALAQYEVERWMATQYDYGQFTDGTAIPYTLRQVFRNSANDVTDRAFDADSPFVRWALRGNAVTPSPLLRALRSLVPEAPSGLAFSVWLAAQTADPALSAPKFAEALGRQGCAYAAAPSIPARGASLAATSPVWERCECGRKRPEGRGGLLD